jgi:hypothetical protein
MELWTFGEPPLAQTARAATLLRQVTGLVLAAEQPDPAVDRLVAELEGAVAALGGPGAADLPPRVGAEADGDGRVYLDHGRDIGAYDPMFPEYRIDVHDETRATGEVTFPIAYEGPPGIVHGGFLAVFFDCVVQHHHCVAGLAGRTTALSVRYRRPTPLLRPLAFEVDRNVGGGRIHSTARLLDGDRLLCEAEVDAIEGDHAALPAVSPRRGTA